jgi:hypothetical protein
MRMVKSGSSPDGQWVGHLTDRERCLVQFVLAQVFLRAPIEEGPAVELRASGDDRRNSLFPMAATVDVNSGDASEALRAIHELKGDLRLILIHNALQFLIVTRQFLGACFSKIAVGGMLIVSVPHQFLYERKLRLPSRRNRLHRRFYTPNTLMADIEEAVDPCEFQLRFLAENDDRYDYKASLNSEPSGGQDIVVALEKIARPSWRSGLDQDELWTESAMRPIRYLEVDKLAPAAIRTVAPDRQQVDRIVVLKLDHRGDFIMAEEAFRILREAFEGAEITLVCGTWNVAEAAKFGLFDEVLEFDFFPADDSAGLEPPPREVLIESFAKRISGDWYDLAIDLRLYDDTRDLLQVVKARNRAGFDRHDLFPWLSVRLNIPSATADDRADGSVITANDFITAVGKHRAFEIKLDASHRLQNRESLIWGPYKQLKRGRYQLECLMEPLAEEFKVLFDVVCDEGRRTILAGVLPISRGKYPRLHFQITERVESFEFRIIGNTMFEAKPFRFAGIRVARQAAIRGVHQTEAMALLAHLVRLRLHNAYTTELL